MICQPLPFITGDVIIVTFLMKIKDLEAERAV